MKGLWKKTTVWLFKKIWKRGLFLFLCASPLTQISRITPGHSHGERFLPHKTALCVACRPNAEKGENSVKTAPSLVIYELGEKIRRGLSGWLRSSYKKGPQLINPKAVNDMDNKKMPSQDPSTYTQNHIQRSQKRRNKLKISASKINMQ